MRLLEITGGVKTKAEVLNTIRQFADVRLGKGVVPCKDTPDLSRIVLVSTGFKPLF